jgi:hypothetical protein
MVFLGCSIVFAMVLYLIDKNRVWKQFLWITRALFVIVLGYLVIVYGIWAWQVHQAQKSEAAAPSFIDGLVPKTEAASHASSIPPGAVIVGGPIAEMKRKAFGNATVEADAAIVWNGMTKITVLSHPARVQVVGEKGSKYQVRLADGRTGEMEKTEIKRDAKAAIPNQDMKVLP